MLFATRRGATPKPCLRFEGLVDAFVVDAVATQTYEPTAVADCILRFYINQRFRSQGVGAALVEALHGRLQPASYVLRVVKGNDGAVRFYERHGLIQEDILDGIERYQAAGVSFPPNPRPFELVMMRYRADDAR